MPQISQSAFKEISTPSSGDDLSPIKRLIEGFGFGGSKQPTNEDDDGISTARAVLIELLSEGPVEGLIGNSGGIYLDRTPVRNRGSGKRNFPGFKFVFRRGGAFQNAVPAFKGKGMATIASETEVGVQVQESMGAVTRTIINSELDVIGVRYSLTLQKLTDKGDVKADEIHYRISTKEGSANWRVRLDKEVKYKFSTPTEFEHEFNVNNQGGTVDTFQVKIEVLSEDGDQDNTRILRWQSYIEQITNKLNYRYSCICAMEFLAKQFSSIPERAYRIAGRTVQIPSNATVAGDRGLNFSGTWDGQFITPTKACSDPVWQLYDLLTNRRYGLGKYIPDLMIDKWSLYEISRYNNQMVATGQGSQQERRYRCNVQLQSKESAWNVLGAFCSACNMKAYYAEGTIFFWQDRPGDTVRQFTQADIENGEFVYSTTAVRSRYTVAMVSWNDPKDFYRRNIETVEDPTGIERYGIRETEIVAFGCTSRSQAIRMGRWALFSSQYETRTVAFTCRSWAAYVRPGEIIQIADAKISNKRRTQSRQGGLIRTATTTEIMLDADLADSPEGAFGLSNDPDTNPKITVMVPDGTLETGNISSYRSVEINSDSDTPVWATVVEVDTPFSQTPNPESNWIISTFDPYIGSRPVQPKLFRVLSATPATSDPTRVEIMAIQYYPEKYALIEAGEEYEEEDDPFRLPDEVSLPRNVKASLITITDNGTTRYALQGTWQRPRLANNQPDATIAGYRVEFSLNDSTDWQGTMQVSGDQFEARFENLPFETYRVRVSAIDLAGRSSEWVVSGIDVTLQLDWSGGRRLSILTKAV
jgi:predicted phage tail protein